MKTYIVGGAVRDYLLGLEPKDKDYVVEGSTPAQMKLRGFKQVGADFPVFLHPETKEEYALARTERKTGIGYVGFTTDFTPNITIEQDLQRRDLTINSMAIEAKTDKDWLLFDPFGGHQDLHNKILRHTSDAFSEDPVRVLRIARFRARFGKDWKIAPATALLIHKMGKDGLLDELTTERVLKEMSRALEEKFPRLFFDTLLELDVLHIIFPEIYALKHSLESRFWHPEGDSYEHTMLVIEQARATFEDRFIALTHDLGKTLTPKEKLPAHHGHENVGVTLVEQFSLRLRIPKQLRLAAMEVCKNHMLMKNLHTLNPKTVVKLFDSLKYPDYLYNLAKADHRGRQGYERANINHLLIFYEYKKAYDSVRFEDIKPTALTSNSIKNAFRHARLAAVRKTKKLDNE